MFRPFAFEKGKGGISNEHWEEEEEEEEGEETTPYVKAPKEEFGELGDKAQTEEFAEENKSVIWELLKQVSCRRER